MTSLCRLGYLIGRRLGVVRPYTTADIDIIRKFRQARLQRYMLQSARAEFDNDLSATLPAPQILDTSSIPKVSRVLLAIIAAYQTLTFPAQVAVNQDDKDLFLISRSAQRQPFRYL
ncbi:hypothetical protein CC2G_000265 [Coprinopsis cinerea AmutBmut pab1-1]|nr:hypothetical protein CC2G_000265 [Coprinopsis cinerea AmutBmut pab1-1]